jgi:hypothetical protein
MGQDAVELRSAELRRRVDPDSLPFETTADIEPVTGAFAQPRAVEAIELGLAIQADGFNIFLAGLPGSGREQALRDHLEQIAPERPVPDDWGYVHDFEHPERPRAIRLPAGRGRVLSRDMERFVEQAQQRIPHALQSEEFVHDRERATAELARRRAELTEQLQGFADERGFALQPAQGGFASAPQREGRPLSPEQVAGLPDAERSEFEERAEDSANAHNVMLADEVLDAVEGGRFHVWAIETVDQGIALLTGRPAGERATDGTYPANTVNRRAEDALRGFADRLRAFGAAGDGDGYREQRRLAQVKQTGG